MPTSLSKQLNRKLAQEHAASHHKSAFSTLALGALGVVYGDIGTSPLYTVKESFSQMNLPVNAENLMCFLSMIFWLLVIVVSVKYVMFILRADNRGEGGNLALLALVLRLSRSRPKLFYFMSLAGILGGSLFYADAVITPAISVLSAVEGLEVIAPAFTKLVVPITIAILIGLFAMQKYGTGKMGALFGPIMLLWFATLGVFGIIGILHAPRILEAISPLFALKFIVAKPLISFVAIGATMLAVTGAEALYADMGHFGANPIRSAWFAVVWPSLVLNYFGQGALLLTKPEAIENPFYLLAPHVLYIPLLVLSAAATVIASQAVISGTYSLTRQAIQLGYLPRMRILHTSVKELGQIYLPFVNWALLCLTIFIVLVFPTSDSLASAYGLAVTGAMLITSMMVSVVMWLKWRWSWGFIAATAGVFVVIDSILFSATLTKFFSGGAMPVALALMIFTALTTWKRGQMALNALFSQRSIPIERFIKEVHRNPPIRVPGTAIFMTPYHNVVPDSLLQNLKHNRMLHERVIFLTLTVQEIPTVPEENRIRIRTLGDDFFQLEVHFGFNDVPDMSDAYNYCLKRGMDFDNIHQTSFYLGRETIIPLKGGIMALWRERIFAIMKQNASSAVEYYNIPYDRVVEIGGGMSCRKFWIGSSFLLLIFSAPILYFALSHYCSVASETTQQVVQPNNIDWGWKFICDTKITDFALAFFTLGLLLSTTLLWFSTERTAQRQLRAYIFVDTCNLNGLYFLPCPTLKITIKNSGQTPASKVTTSVNILVLDHEQKPIQTPQVLHEWDGISIPQNSDISLDLQMTKFIDDIRGKFINGNININIFGKIIYEDVFGQSHTTNYKMINVPPLQTDDINIRDIRHFGCTKDGNEVT